MKASVMAAPPQAISAKQEPAAQETSSISTGSSPGSARCTPWGRRRFSVQRGEFLAIVGPERLRQVHAAQHGRGHAYARPRARCTTRVRQVDGINYDVGYLTQKNFCLPWRTVEANVRLPLEFRKIPQGGCGRARAPGAAQGRPQRLREGLSEAALGRHAAAGDDRAHARLQPRHLPDGRALRQPRRAAAHQDARRAPEALAGDWRDLRLRHPRPARGDHARRPRGGDVEAPGPARSWSSTSTCRGRATSSTSSPIRCSAPISSSSGLRWTSIEREERPHDQHLRDPDPPPRPRSPLARRRSSNATLQISIVLSP